MTKILFLTHSMIGDRTFGGAIRANAIRDALIKLGQVDTLIIHGGPTFSMDEHWDESRARYAKFSVYGLTYRAKAERRAVGRWVGSIIEVGGYDVIVVQYLDLATLVPRYLRHLTIYDPDDFVKTARGGLLSIPARAKVVAHNVLAQCVAKQARHVWYVNPADRPLPSNSSRSALPNIIAMPAVSRPRVSSVPGRILMVGHLLHGPNVDGLRWFAERVLPQLTAVRPEVELHVIGRHPDDLPSQLSDVRFHGFVEDLSENYDRANLVIAPIRSGAGTQIKVIDALAHGRPLITSSFAHSGFAGDLHEATHLMVARSSREWTAQILWALDHLQEIEAMARVGESVVRVVYGQERMDLNVEATLKSLGNRPE